MLNRYSLFNFKTIKSLQDFIVHPLTILSGINSSGKSSFLQSLLLLKQSHQKYDTNKALILNGDIIQLGTSVNLINSHKPANILEFKIDFDYFYNPNNNDISYTSSEIDNFEKLTAKVYLAYEIIDSQFVLNAIKIFPSDDESNMYILNLQKLDNDLYTLEMEGSRQYLAKIAHYNGLFPELKLIYENEKITPMQTFDDKMFANKILSENGEALGAVLNTINYIGPFREPPLRHYYNIETNTQVGSRGQNAAVIYAQQSDCILSNVYIYDEGEDDFIVKDEIKILDAVREWMNIMGFCDLSIDYFEDLISLSIKHSGNEQTRVNITDIGFGCSQLFPIILQGLSMSESQILLLEQPEIHLHPLLQMKLGDFLISLVLSGKQVIVETHSEHIINRLVRRIVEDESNTLINLSGIHFLSQKDGEMSIEDVSVNDIFGITNWPTGFFDQSVDEKEQILLSSLRKRQSKRRDTQ